MQRQLQAIGQVLWKHIVVLLILAGVAVRIVGFPGIPHGLNQDEAIVAYNALTLLREGVEPYGNPYPVNLLSWEQGSPVLGAVVMMPTIALFGATTFAIRFPYLLAGCLTLPLLYFFLRKIADRETAIIGLFLLVVSPWHIQLSRWALDANVLPPLLLAGCTLLITSRKRPPLLYASMAVFALSLYAYGPACVVVPVLVLACLPYLLWRQDLPRVHIAGALSLFTLLAAPMGIYVLMNTNVLPWDTVHLGPLSIPRIQGVSRFVNQGFFSRPDAIAALRQNAGSFLSLLQTQWDGNAYNVLPRFGIVYGIGTAFTLWGFLLMTARLWKRKAGDGAVVMAWVLGCFALGPLVDINLNRVNAVWLPCIILAAIGFRQLRQYPVIFRLAVAYILLWFFAFLYAYFFRFTLPLRYLYQGDLYGAIRHTIQTVREGPICVTGSANAPQVYTILAAELPSEEFRVAQRAGSGVITRVNRFTIGLERCDPSSKGYVVTAEEFNRFHGMDGRAIVDRFGNFVTITPAP